MADPLRHRQTKGAATDMADLTPPRHIPTLRKTDGFDRNAAGFSPDRVDALVWAMSDLLVEPMPNEGHFEYMRQRAAALKKPPPEPPKPVYAPGSLEYERQQAEKGE